MTTHATPPAASPADDDDRDGGGPGGVPADLGRPPGAAETGARGKGGRGSSRRKRSDPEGRMALREHLTELRKRVVRAGLAILVGAVAGWFLYDPVFNYLTAPVRELQATGEQNVIVNFTGVASAFDLQLKMSIWIGVILSSPLWIYQLWAFITPGLTRRERRYAFAFVGASVPLFLAGVGLASLFIPNAVGFFTAFVPEGNANYIPAADYLGFVMRTILTFGVAFLLPVILVGLNVVGLLPGAAVLRSWRWVLVLCFTLAAIATPTPDITAMFTLATPVLILFAVAIAICILNDRRRAKKAPAYLDTADGEASAL